MPKAEYPGVPIEELSGRAVSIPGVPTSISKDHRAELEEIQSPHSIPGVAHHGALNADEGVLGKVIPYTAKSTGPVKYDAPDFNVSGTDVAIETIELPNDCEPEED